MTWAFRSAELPLMVVALAFAPVSLLAVKPDEILPQCNHTIVNVTGHDVGAATDSSIWVRLEHINGDQATFSLHNGLNDFERAQVDSFLVSGNCVQNICKVVLYTDDKGFFPRWYVETVKINEKRFPMHSWLPRDDGLNSLFIVRNECHYK